MLLRRRRTDRVSTSCAPVSPGRVSAGRAVCVVGLLSLLTACGQAAAPQDAGTSEPAARPADHLIDSGVLPQGWRDSNSQGVDYRVTVCGVDLEPEPPAFATSARFSQGPVGPFLEQHVRVYRRDVVSGVIGQLEKALPGCSRYTARGTSADSPTATFTVEPLRVEGAPAQSVSWRQTSQGELPITSDLVLVRRGDTGVLLMSYAIRKAPDPAVLEAALAALPQVR
jgi:hypothetical protein